MKRTLGIVTACVLGACSTAGSDGGGGASAPDGAVGGGGAGGESPDGAVAPAGSPTLFTIILENQDYVDVVGSPNAPYLNQLIAQGGLATHYTDTGHPSLANYLNMVSGENQYPGWIDLGPKQWPFFPTGDDNLADQMEAAGIAWRSYQESMGTPCLLEDSGDYAPKHDPFLYFKSVQGGDNDLCAQTNVDYAEFAGDLASNAYRYMWITPNLSDDGHNPTDDPVTGLRNADAWMSNEVPKILASAGFQSGGALFITWDEAEGRGNDAPDQIPMIILSPRTPAGYQSAQAYSHASFLATVEDMLGLPRIDTVASEPSLMEFFP